MSQGAGCHLDIYLSIISKGLDDILHLPHRDSSSLMRDKERSIRTDRIPLVCTKVKVVDGFRTFSIKWLALQRCLRVDFARNAPGVLSVALR